MVLGSIMNSENVGYIVIGVIAIAWLVFIGAMVNSSDKNFQFCIQHGGSWVEGSCLMDKRAQ